MNDVVLVVDDSPEIRELFSFAFSMYKINSLLAENGAHGLQVYKANKDKIKIVISDIKMPEMDGIQFCKELKKMSDSVYVILMTGYAGSYVWDEIVLSGASNFFKKPFNVLEIIAAIKNISKELLYIQEMESKAMNYPDSSEEKDQYTKEIQTIKSSIYNQIASKKESL